MVAKSDFLRLPESHEILLNERKIHFTDIEGDPALLWGHKDSFNLDYMTRKTSSGLGGKGGFDSYNRMYSLYLQYERKAAFFRNSQCVLEFDLDH